MTCLSPEKLDADVCAELAADSSSFQKLKKFLSSPFSAFSSFPLLSLSLKNSNWTARQLWLGS